MKPLSLPPFGSALDTLRRESRKPEGWIPAPRLRGDKLRGNDDPGLKRLPFTLKPADGYRLTDRL